MSDMERARQMRIREACRELGVELSDVQAEQLADFYTLLTEKNKVMNLTAITEFEEVVIKHFVDSLSLKLAFSEPLPFPAAPGRCILDLGTGAGFPGIPLKIAYPETTFVLADSLQKRIHFLDEAIDKLKLEKIKTVHGRAEELAHREDYREQFDCCVSRAVARLSSLSEYCLPFVKQEGFFVAYKSESAAEELEAAKRAIRLLGGRPEPLHSFSLPCSEFTRSLVVIRKVEKTPEKYPRKPGLPARSPL